MSLRLRLRFIVVKYGFRKLISFKGWDGLPRPRWFNSVLICANMSLRGFTPTDQSVHNVYSYTILFIAVCIHPPDENEQ